MDIANHDFIVKRKRRRPSAVDPCLGFYQIAESSPPRKIVASQPTDLPRIQVLDEPITHSPELTITTVDQFLRNTLSTTKRPPPANTYTVGRQRKRARQNAEDSFVVVPSDEEDARQPKPPRSRRKRAQKPPPKVKLAQRMWEAVVSTGVEPSDSFMKQVISDGSTRQPLRFVPLDSPSPPNRLHRRSSLVDPKKTVLRRSSFPSPPLEHKKGLRQPVTKWRCDASNTIQNREAFAAAPPPPPQITTAYSALDFIDSKEAEAVYAERKKARQAASRSTRHGKKNTTHGSANGRNPLKFIASTVSPATPIRKAGANPHLLSQPAPLEFVTVANTRKVKELRRPCTPDVERQFADSTITSPVDATSEPLFNALPSSPSPSFNSLPPHANSCSTLSKTTALVQSHQTNTQNALTESRSVISIPASHLKIPSDIDPQHTFVLCPDTLPANPISPPTILRQDNALEGYAAPSNASPRILCENSSSPSPTGAPQQQVNPKVLRPLASFLNEFYETARAMTQSTSQAPRPPQQSRARRPVTAARLENYVPLTSAPVYDDRSLAVAFEEEEEAAESESDGDSDEDLLRTHFPPDLSRLLRPSQYDVVLQ